MDEGYEDKADNHEEKPGKYFFRAYHMPDMGLRRIDPDMHRGSDIFRDPYHKRHESESDDEAHRVVPCIGSKVYLCMTEEIECYDEYYIAEIRDKVVREKIDINGESESDSSSLTWVVSISKIEYPPDSSDVTPDRGIHKSRKEGHSHNTDNKTFWIAP